MTKISTVVQRAIWLVVLGAAAGTLMSWLRGRTAPPSPPDAPEWPPLTTVGGVTAGSADSPAGTSATITTTDPSGDGDAADELPGESTDTSAGPGADDAPASTASVVNALIDAPEARSDEGSGDWVTPDDDGSCPVTHPIKANDNSGIYHEPGGTFYERTKAERCYATGRAAEADGYRKAKS